MRPDQNVILCAHACVCANVCACMHANFCACVCQRIESDHSKCICLSIFANESKREKERQSRASSNKDVCLYTCVRLRKGFRVERKRLGKRQREKETHGSTG